MPFIVFLTIIQLIISFIYSIISYPIKKFRINKYKNKLIAGSFTDLKPFRMLTKQERDGLETYLSMNQSSGKKKSSLVSREVMLISGSCVKQTKFSHTENTCSYKIQNIDVVFPFNMDRYLTDYNEVEIALTQNFAIAVKVNDHQIGSALYATYLADEKNDKQSSVYWQSGVSKYSKDENFDENAIHTVRPNAKLSKKLGYEILSVRKETSQESASRNKLNKGILTVFFCSFVVSYFNRFWDTKELNDLFWFAVNLLVAIYFYFRKPKNKAKVRFINQIKGKIDKKIVKSNEIIIGHGLKLKYPKNWQSFIPENSAFDVDLDVDVESKKIVRYGYDMSVNKEVEQFGPPKFWGRNLWLFLAGMFYLYAINNQAKVSDNFLFAYHQYNHDSKSWFFDDPSKLVTSDIKSGDVVKLNFLDVSCEVPVKNKADRCIEALIQSADTSFHLASSSSYFLLHGLKENTTSQSGESEDPQSIVHADHVTVSGFVSNVDYDANHTISTLTINTQELYQKDISENLLPICVNLLLFLLFASATIFNGIMLLLKPIVNRIRNFKIKNIYTYRLL